MNGRPHASPSWRPSIAGAPGEAATTGDAASSTGTSATAVRMDRLTTGYAK